MASKFHTIAEPMYTILRKQETYVQEYEQRKRDGIPIYVPPMFTFNEKLAKQAADAHARANISDPFAKARMMAHMRRGLENPHEVIKASNALLLAKLEAKERKEAA